MTLPEATSSEYWIIGYGNAQRRDDGIGPYVVNRLRPLVASRGDVHLRASHQLEPDWIEPLKNATTILFVDAAIRRGVAGRRWMAIQPELKTLPFLGHQVTPAFILGWLQCLYRRCPTAWLVTIEGNDFRFGSGLSPVAQKRAEQVIGEITELVSTQGGDPDRNSRTCREKCFITDKPLTGGKHECRKGYTRYRRRPGPGGYPLDRAGQQRLFGQDGL